MACLCHDNPHTIVFGERRRSMLKCLIVRIQQCLNLLNDLHIRSSFLSRLLTTGCFSFWHYNNTYIVKCKIPKTCRLIYLFCIVEPPPKSSKFQRRFGDWTVLVNFPGNAAQDGLYARPPADSGQGSRTGRPAWWCCKRQPRKRRQLHPAEECPRKAALPDSR